MNEEISLAPIDRLIVITLKSRGKPLSTYELAKETKISWSTANTHCYKLKSVGLVDRRSVRSHFGQKKVFWSLIEESAKD
ncbi:MAG: hypothetical protein U9Q22_07785 [Candidatus Altiarchaeota archaeon]|nr:hypothetical protein [Candidatus Altiarchaeota archaeon]